MSNEKPTVPFGYCQCGCGQKTPLHAHDQARRGYVKGEPRRYAPGHYHGRDPRREFEKRVGSPDENDCWPWLGPKNDKGYGMFFNRGRRLRAYRVAYELHVGPIPVGLEPDHLCRNRWCVNPAHLEAVTHAENSRRSSSVKLNPENVREIRRLRAEGVATKALAAHYGVAVPTIQAIKDRRIWRDI